MHRAGIYHQDLHLKNILICPQENFSLPKVYIIDFDKAILKKKLSPQEKINNLLRFNRSIEKYKLQGGIITRTDQMRLFKEYFKDNSELLVLFKKYLTKYKKVLNLRRVKWNILGYTLKPPESG